MENNQPKSFPSVRFFASDNYHNSFTSDLGSICNFKLQSSGGQNLSTDSNAFNSALGIYILRFLFVLVGLKRESEDSGNLESNTDSKYMYSHL